MILLLLSALRGTGLQDVALVRAALKGRRAAVRILVHRLMPVIRAQVGFTLRRRYRRNPSAGDIDDLTQEMWLALFEGGGRKLLAFDPERGASFEGYVGMVAERELADRLRKEGAKKRGGDQHRADPELLERLPGAGSERALIAADQARRLGAHIDSVLPERGQLVFRYLYVDGRAPQEAARAMGVNTQVVYNWQHKIRQVARAFLAS